MESKNRSAQWYVHDFTDGFRYFDTEHEARDAFLKAIQDYTEEAMGDEWPDETEHLSWGRIYQTVDLVRVENSENDEYDLVVEERRGQ